MPTVKCSTPTCTHTIVYFCHKITALAGAQLSEKKEIKTHEGKQNTEKRILTLQCYDGHRDNYETVCEE